MSKNSIYNFGFGVGWATSFLFAYSILVERDVLWIGIAFLFSIVINLLFRIVCVGKGE